MAQFKSSGIALILTAMALVLAALGVIVAMEYMPSHRDSPRAKADANLKEQIVVFDQLTALFDGVEAEDDFRRIGSEVTQLHHRLKELKAEFAHMTDDVRTPAMNSNHANLSKAESRLIAAKRAASPRGNPLRKKA